MLKVCLTDEYFFPIIRASAFMQHFVVLLFLNWVRQFKQIGKMFYN